MKSVVFPENLTFIGKEAFYFSGLEGKLMIPEGVTEIEESAFLGVKT